jgi:hypothetical protein
MSQFFDIDRDGKSVQIEVADEVLLQRVGPHGVASPEASVTESVTEALANPHQFLPLFEMLVPGDHLAIALETGLPDCDSIVHGVLKAVQQCELGKVEVVVSDTLDADSMDRLKRGLPDNVQLTIHRLGDRGSERYLGADEDAEPIRLNLSLVDADFVLPISVMRVTDPLVGGPSADALFPGMVDDGQLKRLQRSTLRSIEKHENYHNDWAAGQSEQVRWALGVQLMLAVEVNAVGGVGRVIASSPESLREAIRTHFATSRGGGDQGSSDVVVACVDGGASQQSMENLVRAALVGRSYASPSGSVVLVTDLKSLGHRDGLEDSFDDDLAPQNQDANAIESTYDYEADEREPEPVAPVATALSQPAFARKLLSELINHIDSSRRYLLWSACEPEVAEAFGFGVITDAGALARLVNQHDQCCWIRAAQTAPDAGVLASFTSS